MSSDVSAALLTILQSRSSDLVWLAEIYAHDELPGASGFDPASALEVFCGVEGITYMTRTYRRSISKFGDISQNKAGSFNNASITFDNVDRYLMSFHLANEIEGMILVIRIISRSVSTTLADSLVIFTGRCDKPGDISRTDFPLTAKEYLGTIDLELPPRKFSYDDDEGRRANDPLFEGFRFLPRVGTFTAAVREQRTGLLSFLGSKKVTKTFQWSSHSAIDANKPVPMAFGRVQMQGLHVGYGDFGNSIAMMTAWCDGGSYGIHGYVNPRNTSPNFGPLDDFPEANFPSAGGIAYVTYGEVGLTGGQLTAPIAGTQAPNVGLAYYSRTAWSYTFVNGSAVDVDDPAPELASIIYGFKMHTPNSSGVWGGTPKLSDNPADIWRYVLTDPHYMNVSTSMIDQDVLYESWLFCNQYLVDQANTDTVILRTEETSKAGVEYHLWKSTGVTSPDHFKWLNDEAVNPFEQEAEYDFQSVPPIENGGGGGGEDPTNPDPGLVTKYRRRFTCNFPLIETQKAVDVLKNILYPSCRGYVTYGANGKIQFRIDKPADNALIRSDIAIGVTEIPVYSILPWRTGQLLKGQIVIGAHLSTSEVKTVTGWRTTTAGNAITLTASGGVTASGATLTGGDNVSAASSGTVTVTSAVGTKTVTIDGIPIIYIPVSGETTATAAGLIYAAVNSHSILNQYIQATWTPGTAIVTLTSKLGFLTVSATVSAHTGPIASPTVPPTGVASSGGNLAPGNWKLAYSYETDEGETLVSPSVTIAVTANQKITTGSITKPATVTGINWYLSRLVGSSTLKYILSNDGSAHIILKAPNQTAPFVPARNSTAEEVVRVMKPFSNRANVQSNCTRGNMLEKSFKWPLGTRQKSVNKIVVKYREASDDFRLTELRVKDSRHIAKVGKELPLEINGTAIDNFHQAVRIANGALAENRDADFFVTVASDGDALLLDVGDVICVTELDNAGVGFVNLLVRIEDKAISESTHAKVTFTARKYASSLYDDDVYERTIPLPTQITPKRIDGVLELDDLGGTRTLTDAEARNKTIEIPASVTLTSDLTIEVPDHSIGYLVRNHSAGAFQVFLKTVSGSPVEAFGGATSLMMVNSSTEVEKVTDSKTQENVVEIINGISPIDVSPAGSKTFDIGLESGAQNLVIATPNGSAGAGTYRALVAADIPSLPASQITSGTLGTARLGSGTANSGTVLRGDQTWADDIVGSLGINEATPTARLHLYTNSASTKGIVIRGTAGQTNAASLLEIQKSDTSIIMQMDYFGRMYLNAGAFANFGPDYIDAALTMSPRQSNTVAMVIRAHASQTANLQQWEDSGGNAMSAIDAAGKLVFSADTNLYRSAANVLKTDDDLLVNGSVGIGATTLLSKLHVVGQDQGFIFTYDAANNYRSYMTCHFDSGSAAGNTFDFNVCDAGTTTNILAFKMKGNGDVDMPNGNLLRGGTKVVGARGAALTAANAGAINSGDATTDAVIGNIRTRLGEMEARLSSAAGHGLFT